MIPIPDGVVQRDVAAEGRAPHDRADDPQCVTQCDQVVRPLIQVPAVGFAVFTSAVPAMVVVDDLGKFSEGSEEFLEGRRWSAPFPCSITMVGRSRIDSPSGTSFALSTSTKSRTSPTETNILLKLTGCRFSRCAPCPNVIQPACLGLASANSP